MPLLRPVLETGSLSFAGIRPENQDRVTHFDSPFGHVFLLADGMGGHRGGAVASSLVVSRLPAILRAQPSSLGPQEALVESIQILNRAIVEESQLPGSEVTGMGSTL